MERYIIVVEAVPGDTAPVAVRTVEVVGASADMDVAVHPPDTFRVDTLLDKLGTAGVHMALAEAADSTAAEADMVVAAVSCRKP